MEHPYNKFRSELEIVLRSKIDEFALYNYYEMTTDRLWEFLLTRKWRKPKDDIHLYELVSDILSLKVSDFMTFQTVEHLKGPDWFSEEGMEDLLALLKPKKN
ncbi:post-transcriptional regulator [Pallidibacillus pasinlerensis]|uniref:Post-transcriptional regulator n=1 Tax=Pallidibacillus pasinlerensis TaxID=2703818 RepID=A0ABX0A8T1_9BACI|nr:post-transcriptional regulator [Pallidibacillus pasinlerensis]NCU18630.1 post-transcriptional regulator [Pallidibacillus pasinlerensis]